MYVETVQMLYLTISLLYFDWNIVINCCKAPNLFEFISFRNKYVKRMTGD